MASISSLGAGSGLFSSDLVDQILNAEREPTEVRLNQKQQRTEAMISAFGTLKSAVEGLRSSMEGLSSADGLMAFNTSSSNENTVGVSMDESQVNNGTYEIDVQQLARSQSLASTTFADRDSTTVGTGTMTINVGGTATDITIDSSNNTLEGMANAINESGAGVNASVVDTGSGFRLVMSSAESGTANEVQVTVADGDGNNTDTGGLSQFVYDGTTQNLEQTVAAQDALLTINGIDVSRSSNNVSDAVEGLTFELKGTGASTIKVEEDSDAVADRVQAFVDKYNEFQNVVRSISGFNADTGQGGLLNGDSTIRNLQNDLREVISSVVPGLENGTVRTLADIGIATDPDDNGKLTFDQSVFKDKLDQVPGEVAQLFAEVDGAEGVAARITAIADNMLASDGTLSNRTEGLNEKLEGIREERNQLDMRMESMRERLVKQFTAADQLISQLQSTQDFVSQQLAALAPSSSQNG